MPLFGSLKSEEVNAKLFFVFKQLCGRHGNNVIRMRTHAWVLLVSLRSEEVNALSFKLFVVVQTMWLSCNTHVYQVSSPCVLPLTSLRIEERKLFVVVYEHLVVMETYSCHGRHVIRMYTISMCATVNKF